MKKILAILLLPGFLTILSMSVLSLSCYAAGQSSSQPSYFSNLSLLGFDRTSKRGFTNYHYSFAGGDAGIRLGNRRENTGPGQKLSLAAGEFRDICMTGYIRKTLGPLAIQGEALVSSEKSGLYDAVTTRFYGQNQDGQAMALHLDARMDRGTAYVGSRILYAIGGNDAIGKKEGMSSSGQAMAFGMESLGAFSTILLNGGDSDSLKTLGNAPGVKNNPDSIRLYQVYGGYSPSNKIGMMARLNYAEMGKARAGDSKSYGAELDLLGSYRISDNLTYNIGAAYILSGSSFKDNTSAETSNAYHLLHWLNLDF